MTAKRLYLLLLGCILLLFAGLIGGVYSTNKLLAKRATTLTAYKAKSEALKIQQQILDKDKRDIERYSDLKKITQQIVPQEKNQAAAVRELVNTAAASKVSIAAITFPASTLGNSTKSKSQTSAKSSKVPKANPAADTKAAALSQLKPVTSIPGVYELVIGIENDASSLVSYRQFLDFLSALEKNRHTAQVQTISLQPDAKNPSLYIFNLTVTEYVKP